MNLFIDMREAAILVHKCRASLDELRYQAAEYIKQAHHLPDTVHSEEQLISLYFDRSILHADYDSVITGMMEIKEEEARAEKLLNRYVKILSHINMLGYPRTYLSTGHICRASVDDTRESELVLSITKDEWRLDYHAV